MLRLFSGRENIDKERFIYDRIAADGGETLVLVPNQYTLVAEEQALKHTGRDCLFDIEILSMNRLGFRLLREKGRESVNMLDRYGRFMLLTRLIKEHKDEFEIFRRSAGKQTFTNMLSDFISEFKQNECSTSKMAEMLEDGNTDPLLKAKLREVSSVLSAYEEAISGTYKDSEEYIDDYIEAIRDSKFVRGKNIWIYGYDSITPKFTRAMLELAAAAESVNFILNRSEENLDEMIEHTLKAACDERELSFSCEEIGRGYELAKSRTVHAIEERLFAKMPEPVDFVPEDLTVVRAANPYYEAESAAAYIWHLVRDLGYKMRDIQVIANDESNMHPIIRRVFAEYGLPVFMDSARDITDTAPVGFIVDLLWFLIYNKNPQYLFAMLKTGLTGVPAETIEDLENYARTYHIRGNMWDRDFKYGEEALGREKFRELNAVRSEVIGKVSRLSEALAKGKGGKAKKAAAGAQTGETADGRAAADGHISVADFTVFFRNYLDEVWGLPEAVQKMADEEEALGYIDEAQRTLESFDKAMEMLDQINEIMGDSEFDLTEFTEIYVAGLTNVEVGVIPPAADGLSVGTMIRTRPRPVRAAVILGANEGTLPMQPSPEGLFSIDEKAYFTSNGFALGSLDDIKLSEEKAAMYRMMSKPSEKIYISWSLTDSDGREAAPSTVIDSLKMLFPSLEKGGILRDVVSAGWGDASLFNSTDQESLCIPNVSDTMNSPGESMRHMIARIKDRSAPEEPDSLLRAMLAWYKAKRSGELDIMLAAAADENEVRPLGKQTAKNLFSRPDGSLVLSASSISGYFDCPFKFFVERGLRPQEERSFSSDPRSIGDAYHECLMAVARRLLGDRTLLKALAEAKKTDASGGADPAKDDAADVYKMIEKMVDEELSRIASDYEGGLFISANSELYRMDRIREICTGAACAMANQLSAESVLDASFEESFSRTGKFDPISFEVDGQKVYVEGKIDRSDILDVNDEKRVRIIDYKTGKDSLNVWKMRHGYKMQLMIYMISASSGDLEPAGLFYFNIKDPMESLNDKSAKKEKEIRSREPSDPYKLRGRYIYEPGVLDAMPADQITGGRSEKDWRLSREEYEELKNDVTERIRETAAGILKGEIGIHPFQEGKNLVCANCSYKPICKRDREYTKNYARMIPKQEKKTEASKDPDDAKKSKKS